MGSIAILLLVAKLLLTPHLAPSVSARWAGLDRAVITFGAPGCLSRLGADGTTNVIGCYSAAGSIALPADVAVTPQVGDRYLFSDTYGNNVVAPLYAVIALPSVTC